MYSYRIEGDAELKVYTPEQLGEPIMERTALSLRSRERFDLIVMDNNNQVLVLESQSWNWCRRRVIQMVYAGVDPLHIYGCPVTPTEIRVLGPNLCGLRRLLWWTNEDHLDLVRHQHRLAAGLPTGGPPRDSPQAAWKTPK